MSVQIIENTSSWYGNCFSFSQDLGEVQDMLPQNMERWHIEYFMLQKFEKIAQ